MWGVPFYLQQLVTYLHLPQHLVIVITTKATCIPCRSNPLSCLMKDLLCSLVVSITTLNIITVHILSLINDVCYRFSLINFLTNCIQSTMRLFYIPLMLTFLRIYVHCFEAPSSQSKRFLSLIPLVPQTRKAPYRFFP